MYTMVSTKPPAGATRPAGAPAGAGSQQRNTSGQAKSAAAPKAAEEASSPNGASPEAKAASPATAVPSSRPVTTSTSYAAALKVGTAHDTAAPAGVMGGRDYAAPHLTNSGMNLMFGRMQHSMAHNAANIAIQRPSRSYSEPLVATGIKFEGPSSLNGEVIDEAQLLNRNSSAGAITKAPSSTASSRSNSIAQAPSFLNGNANSTPTLGNLPWLSSPPSNTLDSGGVEFGLQLPPAIEQKSGSHVQSGMAQNQYAVQQQQQGGPPGIVNPSGLWFPAQQQQLQGADAQQHSQQQQHQQAFQQAAMQQQYMGAPFGGMMFMPGPYMGIQPPPPGVAASPDVWAAMVSSHAMHEQMGMQPGQYPGQPFMVPQFPFFSPEAAANAMAFGPGATPQQQMMFFNAQQQQMQAMQMQHMQYAQVMAAQAQMQQARVQQQQGGATPSNTTTSTTPQQGVAGSEHKSSNASPFAGTDGFGYAGKTGAPGLSPPPPASSGAAQQTTNKSSEHTESDDLFNLHGLNLDSPAFEPSAQPWSLGGRR
jgi:hypothetical protein